jgi:predicted RNA-binding protein YlqC (UPF0109 family)
VPAVVSPHHSHANIKLLMADEKAPEVAMEEPVEVETREADATEVETKEVDVATEDAPAAPADATDAASPKESGELTETEVDVEVPGGKIGAIIGRGGETIQSIERVSGAKINTPKDRVTDPSAMAMVKVRGTAEAIEKAKELIAQAIVKPRDSNNSTEGPELTIAGYTFAGRDALWKHCHKIIEELEDGANLSGGAEFFVFALMSNHPNANEKYGKGLVAIKYGTNEEFPDTKCFIAVRTDGSEVGFSYRKCIDSLMAAHQRGNKRGRDDRDDRDTPNKMPKMEFKAGIVSIVDGLGDACDFKQVKECFSACGANCLNAPS